MFDVGDDMIFSAMRSGKKVTVSVTYLDEGGGFFYLTYDSFSGAREYSDFEEIIGTQTVKNALVYALRREICKFRFGR
ncbi:MAG: hypothetical protein L6V93_17640 [Clostridiales bacterium]|nr:MAG: hypothetical protein L6V93_17640 [Clostridiales bacterium]